jgi:hypothetical protein
VPVAIALRSSMGLRMKSPKNGQRSKVHFVADYEIALWTVERLRGAV